MVTTRELQIMAQSQLQRAIEICSLVGFPEGMTNRDVQIDYIVKKLTPRLVLSLLENVEKIVEGIRHEEARDKTTKEDMFPIG